MNTTFTGAVVLGVAGCIAACGGGSGAPQSTSAATAADEATPVAVASPSTSPSGSGRSVTPTKEQAGHLVFVLEAVNPGVSTDEGTLVKTSVEVCRHILAGESKSKVNALTRKAFVNGSYRPSSEEADAMDRAITAYFCR